MQRLAARRSGEHNRAPVGRDARVEHPQQPANTLHLSGHDRIAGPQRFKAVARAHVLAVLDLRFARQLLKLGRVQGPVEGNLYLARPVGPGAHRLRATPVGQ